MTTDSDRLPATKLHCCFLFDDNLETPYTKDAEWEIVSGPSPDDYTHACTYHVGALLTDAPEQHIYPIMSE